MQKVENRETACDGLVQAVAYIIRTEYRPDNRADDP